MFGKFFKDLEQWEKYQPSSFWLCTVSLYLSFSAGFGTLFPESPESPSHAHIVVEQVRGGGREDLGSSTSSTDLPSGITKAYVPPSGTNPGRQDRTINSPPKEYEPGTRIAMGSGNNPGDNGNGDSSWEKKNDIPRRDSWESTTHYWIDPESKYDDSDDETDDEDICSISDSDQPENLARKVNEKFKKSNAVKKLANKTLKDQDVQKEYERIKKRLEKGINPVDIGKSSTVVGPNKVLIKGGSGRYLVEVVGNQVNILGICARGNDQNIDKFMYLMNKLYDTDLKY